MENLPYNVKETVRIFLKANEKCGCLVKKVGFFEKKRNFQKLGKSSKLDVECELRFLKMSFCDQNLSFFLEKKRNFQKLGKSSKFDVECGLRFQKMPFCDQNLRFFGKNPNFFKLGKSSNCDIERK